MLNSNVFLNKVEHFLWAARNCNGSLQFMQAGYRVNSYELSKPRARYAKEKLGCHMVPDLEHIAEKQESHNWVENIVIGKR